MSTTNHAVSVIIGIDSILWHLCFCSLCRAFLTGAPAGVQLPPSQPSSVPAPALVKTSSKTKLSTPPISGASSPKKVCVF